MTGEQDDSVRRLVHRLDGAVESGSAERITDRVQCRRLTTSARPIPVRRAMVPVTVRPGVTSISALFKPVDPPE